MYHQFTKINPQQPQAAGRSLIRLTRKKIRRGGIHVPTCINPIPRAPGRLGSVAYRLRPLIFTASESAPHLLPLPPTLISLHQTLKAKDDQLKHKPTPKPKSSNQVRQASKQICTAQTAPSVVLLLMVERAAALVELYVPYVPSTYTPSSTLCLHFHHICDTIPFKIGLTLSLPYSPAPTRPPLPSLGSSSALDYGS
jgi:hypothetical protein